MLRLMQARGPLHISTVIKRSKSVGRSVLEAIVLVVYSIDYKVQLMAGLEPRTPGIKSAIYHLIVHQLPIKLMTIS